MHVDQTCRAGIIFFIMSFNWECFASDKAFIVKEALVNNKVALACQSLVSHSKISHQNIYLTTSIEMLYHSLLFPQYFVLRHCF